MTIRALLVLVPIVIASCVAAPDEDVGTWSADLDQPACGDHRRVDIAWLGNDPNNTYDNAGRDQAAAVAAATHGTLTPSYAGFDPSVQLEQCEAAVRAHRYQAILVIPDDSVGIEACVADARKRDIPVVATDLPIGPDPATDQPQVPGQAGAVLVPAADWGSSLASLVLDLCASKTTCRVAYIAGSFDVAFDQIALADLDAFAAAHGNVQIVFRDQAFYDQGLAYAVAQQILSDDPQVDVIVGAGDQMAEGAELAIADAGRAPGSIQIVGAGAGAYGVQAVLDGRWSATFVSLPADEGLFGARIAVAAARHQHVVDRGIDPVTLRGFPAFFTRANQAAFVGFVPQWPG